MGKFSSSDGMNCIIQTKIMLIVLMHVKLL
jgi:hypothetical protein